MAITFSAPVLLAAAAAGAIAFAPSASATAADCEDYGPSSVCTRNGHAAIVAEPQGIDRGWTMIPGGSPFGSGPNPPLMAID